jgi:hypothetical protein
MTDRKFEDGQMAFVIGDKTAEYVEIASHCIPTGAKVEVGEIDTYFTERMGFNVYAVSYDDTHLYVIEEDLSAEDTRLSEEALAKLREILSGDDDLDMVNHPPHYNFGTIEVIDAIEDWNLPYFLGNVVKYVARCDYKGKPLEDLEKAAFYLDREIKRRKKVSAAQVAN